MALQRTRHKPKVKMLDGRVLPVVGKRPAAAYLPNYKGMRWERDPQNNKPRLVQRATGQVVVTFKDDGYDLSQAKEFA